MKVFISYCRTDTKYGAKVCEFLQSLGISYVYVSEKENFDGVNHQALSQSILLRMSECDLVIAIIGKDTYQRPHVDLELHNAIKGTYQTRKGIVAVFLETRKDGIKRVDFSTYPSRLADNWEYVERIQFSAFQSKIRDTIKKAIKKARDSKIEIDNSHPCLILRQGNYYDQ